MRFWPGLAAGAPRDDVVLEVDVVRHERAASRFAAREVGDPLGDARLGGEMEDDGVVCTLAAGERIDLCVEPDVVLHLAPSLDPLAVGQDLVARNAEGSFLGTTVDANEPSAT